jgi:ABC-2 type transport system permease protein
MNRARRIAAKELLQTRRDRLAALFTVILPVVFTIFLGVIISGMGSGTGIPVAVVDQDLTQGSQQFLDRLEASPVITLKPMAADKIDTAIEDQSVAAALVVPKGFGAALAARQPVVLPLIRLETSTGAQSVVQAVQATASELNSSLLAADIAAGQASSAIGESPGSSSGNGAPSAADLAASAEALVQTALGSPTVSVQTVDANSATDTGDSALANASGFEIASTGSLVQWVLFSLLSIATGVVWERRYGLLRRMASMGVSGTEIIQGKMMGMVTITFLQQLMLVLLGQFAFGVDYFSSPVALLMTMISLSVLASSVGLLISALFRTEPPVIATTVITAQLLAVLGGAWFPLEVTSPAFARVAHFFPSAWIMDALHGIVLKGWGIPQVAVCLWIPWIWIVALFGLAVWRFRPE